MGAKIGEQGGPLVSVICCAYNAGGYLRDAVLSVLEQTYPNVELLVMDDGSTDGSIEQLSDIRDERLRIIRQPNAGKSVALNRALDELRGEYYVIQDADDVSLPTRVERQLRAFEAQPELAAVYCGHELIINDRRYAPRFRAKDSAACRADIAAFRMPAHDPTGMYRVAAVKGVRYDPFFAIGQGYDYILRVGEQHPMVVVGECLYGYRVHPNSVTKRDPAKRSKMVAEVLRRACERRGLSFEATFPTIGKRRAGSRVMDNNLATNFIESVVDLRRVGRWGDALTTGLACARLHPFEPGYYRALIYAILPTWLRRAVRRTERTRHG